MKIRHLEPMKQVFALATVILFVRMPEISGAPGPPENHARLCALREDERGDPVGGQARRPDGDLEFGRKDVHLREGRQAVSVRYRRAQGRGSRDGPGRGPAPGARGRARPAGGNGTARFSPDKKLKAFHRDRNLWLSDADGKNAFAVTEDGTAKTRVKSGTASWVYGEELDQATAIWWSPDSRKIAFYRFDESRVPDYFLQMDQTKLYSTPDIEAYPKAGEPNPVVDVLIYDVASRKTVRVDVRDGKAFDDDVVGHYVYNVGWSPDGSVLLFNRTNRRQNVLELAACDPATGACRVVVRDEWPTGWVENNPRRSSSRTEDDSSGFRSARAGRTIIFTTSTARSSARSRTTPSRSPASSTWTKRRASSITWLAAATIP